MTKLRAHTKTQRNRTSSSKISITLLFEQDVIELIFYKRSNHHQDVLKNAQSREGAQ
jgi:hypothetical protein